MAITALNEGQRVRCILPIEPLIKDQVYRVRKIRKNDLFGMLDMVEVSHDISGVPVENRPQGFFPWRFRLA